MGLHEKRALAAAQKDKFPGWVKDIQDAAGKELAFEVAWPELCKDGYADSFAAGLAYNFFVPLRQASSASASTTSAATRCAARSPA